MYQGTVPRLFVRYALPQMVGLLFNSAYVIVDGVFIGNRLGTRAMAAAAVSVPLIEILIALSSSAAENELAAAALHQLPQLKGCDVHSTVILSSVDSDILNKLGMYLTCDPAYEEEDRMYHKK